MSFDINSVQGAAARTAPTRTGKATAPEGTFSAALHQAVKVDVGGTDIPASPPPEVLDAMGTAAQSYDRLSAADRGLSFKIDDRTGKVIVAVHNNAGQVLFTVPGSKALDIASGASLDQ